MRLLWRAVAGSRSYYQAVHRPSWIARNCRRIFARNVRRSREISPDLRAKFCANRTLYWILRKPITLLDSARTLWLLPLRTLRRETLSESVSRRSLKFEIEDRRGSTCMALALW